MERRTRPNIDDAPPPVTDAARQPAFGIDEAAVPARLASDRWDVSVVPRDGQKTAGPLRGLPWLARRRRQAAIAGPSPSMQKSFVQIATAEIRPAALTARKRLNLEELQALSRSLRQEGMLQPVIVRPATSGDGFELITGYRRWLAASLAEITEIPAILMEHVDDRDTLVIALVENLHRRDLTIIEEAEANQVLAEKFGHTHDEIANLVGKSRSHVTNIIRLLRLPDPVKAKLEAGQIKLGHARALLGATDPARLAEIVCERQLNVRETEQLVTESRVAAVAPESPSDDTLQAPLTEVAGSEIVPAGVATARQQAVGQAVEQLEYMLGARIAVSAGTRRPSLKITCDSELQLIWVLRQLRAAMQQHSLTEMTGDDADTEAIKAS